MTNVSQGQQSGSPASTTERSLLPGTMPFQTLIVVLLLMGSVARVVTFLDQEGRLFQQFPTEDGYLMMTIARNLGIGKGFSVADGEIPTNGTQPLTTLVWSAGFALVDGDREAGVTIALVLQLLASLLTTWALFRLGARLFKKQQHAREKAALAASAWFASSVALPHTMNCLETGFYALVAVAVGHAFLEDEEGAEPAVFTVGRSVLVGVLLGVAFWVRNDATFLILGACLTYVLMGFPGGMPLAKRRFGRALIFGSTSVVVAVPWLYFNYSNFGHIMPVSGRAESLTGSFGSNLSGVPIVVAEYVMTVLPIPHAMQDHVGVIVAATLIVAAAVAIMVRRWPAAPAGERSLMLLGGIYVTGLSVFYGLFFGAPWFLPRYFLPASPFIALLWTAVVFQLWSKVQPKLGALTLLAPVAMVVVVGFLNVRHYRGGGDHMHFQVVDWIDENLTEDVWVGAIQTGTIGFFHDRTINLDGKVNPHAYEALVEDRIAEYVMASEIEYLADWVGLTDWRTMPLIEQGFEVLVEDEERNLAVMRRRDRGPGSGG